ncbi:MAG: hypothetical protein ACRDOO_08680 [Actinomadura sp.]
MRKSATAVAAVLAAPALRTATAQPALAGGFVINVCVSGNSCVGDGVSSVWNSRNCGFNNMGDEGFADRARNWRTHQDAIQLGNYNGTGWPWSASSFTWSGILPPNSSGQLSFHGYDAMFINC